MTLVPPEFAVPTRDELAGYRLEPLGPEHKELDHAAWTSSVEHIEGLADFADERWPDPAMSPADRWIATTWPFETWVYGGQARARR